jgi:hypothetical protein
MDNQAAVEIPKYACHKEVWALKIKEVKRSTIPFDSFIGPTCRGDVLFGSACGTCEKCKWIESHASAHGLIFPEEPGIAPIEVSRDYIIKHNPMAGGYYVVYQDGYKSYSPAEAFESGYTRIK